MRVAVFAKGDDAAKATAAGADIVGAEDLLDSVLEGENNYNALLLHCPVICQTVMWA